MEHGVVRRLLKGSSWLLFDRVFRLAIGFAVGVLVARHFGPEEFGRLSYVVATASIFGSLSSLGIDDIVARDFTAAANKDVSLADMQKTALLLRVLGGFSAYILLLLIVFWVAGWSPLMTIAIVFGLYFPLQAADVFEARLRVESSYVSIATSRSLANLFSATLKVLVVWLNLPLAILAGAMTFEYVAVAERFWCAIRKGRLLDTGARFKWSYAKSLLHRSWKIMLAGLIIMLQARIEYFMVEQFIDWNAVGQYSAAVKIFELFDVVCIILAMVLLPEIVKKEVVASTVLLEKAYAAGLLVYVFLVPCMLGAIVLFPYVYGAKYEAAVAILPFLVLRPFFGMVNSIRNMMLVIDGSYGYSVVSALFGSLCALASGFFLVPAFGLAGAALNSVVGLFCYTVLADTIFYRKSAVALLGSYKQIGYVLHKIRGAIN